MLLAETLRILLVEDHMALAENLFGYLGEERYELDLPGMGLSGITIDLGTDEVEQVLGMLALQGRLPLVQAA